MSDQPDQDFQTWWYNEGSGITPRPGDDHEEHGRRIAEIAWANGAYKAREAYGIEHGGWISVNDRLPPEDTIVPTIKRNNKSSTGFSQSYGSWNNRGGFCDSDKEIFKRDADFWFQLPPMPAYLEANK